MGVDTSYLQRGGTKLSGRRACFFQSKTVYVSMALYLAVGAGPDDEGWWFVAFFVGVTFVVVDTVPDLVVRPYAPGDGSIALGPFRGSDPTPEPESNAGWSPSRGTRYRATSTRRTSWTRR
jgi:hypothetical protein